MAVSLDRRFEPKSQRASAKPLWIGALDQQKVAGPSLNQHRDQKLRFVVHEFLQVLHISTLGGLKQCVGRPRFSLGSLRSQ